MAHLVAEALRVRLTINSAPPPVHRILGICGSDRILPLAPGHHHGARASIRDAGDEPSDAPPRPCRGSPDRVTAHG